MDESGQKQLTDDDDTVTPMSHAGDNHLPDDYDRTQKADRRQPPMTYY
jgi:hypothetical protein